MLSNIVPNSVIIHHISSMLSNFSQRSQDIVSNSVRMKIFVSLFSKMEHVERDTPPTPTASA